jgi:hypothetical protein
MFTPASRRGSGACAAALVSTVPHVGVTGSAASLREWFGELADQMRHQRRPLPDGTTPEGLMLRAIVPGWPQWYVGHPWQAAGSWSSYGTLMILGRATSPRAEAAPSIGLAFAVHSVHAST